MIRGVDLSRMQGKVSAVVLDAIGVRFAYLRCNVGNDGKDACFEANLAEARSAGLRVGAYNVAYPLPHIDPAKQAEADFDACGGLGSQPGALPPAIDAEWPPREKAGQRLGDEWARWGCSASQIREWFLVYGRRAAQLWGRKTVLYTYKWWWDSLDASTQIEFVELFHLWIADYNKFAGKVPDKDAMPFVVKPWGSSWTLWQHDGDGGLRLTSGVDADFNVFNGGEDAFADFVGEPRPIIDADNQPLYILPEHDDSPRPVPDE